MSLSAAVVFLLWTQAAPQDEKKPDAPAPQEEKKPEQEKPVPTPEPGPEEGEESFQFQPELRIGGWRSGAFDAITPAGRRKIESNLLFDAGLDLRAMYSGWSLSLVADYASGRSMTMEMGGLLIGMDVDLAPEPLPLNLRVAVGPIFGKLDVDVAGFGDFKSAAGFEARIAATTWLHGRMGISIWADYRQIRFKYEETVTSGDTSTGGATFAVGAGIVMRF
jgi:hypothetical protein